ncbi:MAG: cupin domain-containing protein [Planctomycetota bacterium]
MMPIRMAGLGAAMFLLASMARSDGPMPMPLRPESFKWADSPVAKGFRAAWVLGQEKAPGPYILRVKASKGARLEPHSHPDERQTTVLSGTIWVGFGERFDESRMVEIPAGAVLVVPARTPHFVWARQGDAEYQETGVGPTGTVFVPK